MRIFNMSGINIVQEQLNNLANKFSYYMKYQKKIAIHLQTDNTITRVEIIPEEFGIDDNNLYLIYKSFHLIINKIDFIHYYNFEYESYHINANDVEVIFDFI